MAIAPTEVNKLADLFGFDLAGWQINRYYFLELIHTLAGRFPAITTINKADEAIITLDKNLLKKIWNKIDQRPAKVSDMLVLANIKDKIAFNLENLVYIDDLQPFPIFLAEDIDFICQQKNPLRWAPGLFPLRDEAVSKPVSS